MPQEVGTGLSGPAEVAKCLRWAASKASEPPSHRGWGDRYYGSSQVGSHSSAALRRTQDMYRTLPRRFPQLRGHVRVMLCDHTLARANADDGMTAFEKRSRDSCPGPVMSFIYHNRQPDALTQPLRAFFSLRPTPPQTPQATAGGWSAERRREGLATAVFARSLSTSCWHSGTAVAAPEAHVSSTLCVLTHRRRPDQAAALHGSQLVMRCSATLGQSK